MEKINLKDRAPLKPSQKKIVKEFESNCRIVKARLSFHRISTLGEALDIIGKSSVNYDRAQPLSNKLVDELIVELYNELINSFTAPVVEDQALVLWNENDSLIESGIQTGYDAIENHPDGYGSLEGLIPTYNIKQTATLYPFQDRAAKETFTKFVKEGKRAILCPGKTGDGKTLYAGQLLRWLMDSGWCSDDKNFSPWKILYVTKATIVEQTKEELLNHFGLRQIQDIWVTNYEQLRADLGKSMIEDIIIVEDGIERHSYKWRTYMHPLIVVWDECHSLKNEDSIQSQIAQSLNNLPLEAGVIQLFMSATPFSRVCHAKAFAVATRKKMRGALGSEIPITNVDWQRFARHIASPAAPEDYCKAAIKRLLKEFSEYIVPFKNVRRKFKASLKNIVISFETEEERKQYALAWEMYREMKAKIEGSGDLKNSRFLILVQFLKFRQAAELIKTKFIARTMFNAWREGYAPVFACNFKASIAKVVWYLHSEHGVPRDKISLIWGGDAAFGGKGSKDFYTKEEIHDILARCMHGEEIDVKVLKAIQHQLMMESSGLADLPKELELGQQSKTERWRDIKRFQSGKSEFCLFSYKSGGAGLSLHQNKPFLRPRIQFNSTTYNEMEMQQAEGRTCRLTSLANVDIITFIYRGTIEVPVMQRVTAKRQCLNVVMSHGAEGRLDSDIILPNESELKAIIDMMDTRTPEEKEEDDSNEFYDDESE